MEIFIDIYHEILFMVLGQLIIFQIVHSMFAKGVRNFSRKYLAILYILRYGWCGLDAVWQLTEN